MKEHSSPPSWMGTPITRFLHTFSADTPSWDTFEKTSVSFARFSEQKREASDLWSQVFEELQANQRKMTLLTSLSFVLSSVFNTSNF